MKLFIQLVLAFISFIGVTTSTCLLITFLGDMEASGNSNIAHVLPALGAFCLAGALFVRLGIWVGKWIENS